MKGRFYIVVVYTINELEKVLHRKYKTIKEYIDYGGLKASNINGRYLISEEDLKVILQKQNVTEQNIEQFIKNKIKEQTEQENSSTKFTPVNQMFSYGRTGNTLHMHLIPKDLKEFLENYKISN